MAVEPQLKVVADAAELASACAEFLSAVLKEAITRNGHATFAISGGSTPKPMFQILANSGVDWNRVELFWVDERCVPPDHEQSNYRMAKAALVDPSGIPAANVHRIQGELDPEQAAQAYVEEIRTAFRLRNGAVPVFDVVHRGIGPDAHTASLFPGEPLIQNEADIAAAVWVQKMNMHRVTLLPGVLKAAKQTVIEAAGGDKAEAIYEVLFGPEDPMRFPCQIAARNSDRAVWFLDRAAAERTSASEAV